MESHVAVLSHVCCFPLSINSTISGRDDSSELVTFLDQVLEDLTNEVLRIGHRTCKRVRLVDRMITIQVADAVEC